MGWLLNLGYLFVLTAAAPWIGWRMVVARKYRAGWAERLGGFVAPPPSTGPTVWLHAVSVGEVLQLGPVLEGLRKRYSGHTIVVSTGTETGLDVARQRYPECHVTYCPLDFTWAVRRAFARIQPDAFILVELELWPNLLREAHRRGIPVVLINGRLSEKSFRGYSRLKHWLGPILARFQAIGVQTETYGERFVKLGVPRPKVTVTGSIKFDGVQFERDNTRTNSLRELLGISHDETVFIAGSTQAPEEAFALAAYETLRERHPNLRLILVPRHPQRFEEVAALVESAGLPLLRRSRIDANQANPDRVTNDRSRPIVLLDTVGELAACWGLADIAFVGGSFGERGGQNMIEPAAYGAAVLFGPKTQNFRHVVEMLLAHDAAKVVVDGEAFNETVASLIADREAAHNMGLRAQELVRAQQGATDATIDLIFAAFPECAAKAAA